MSDEAPKPPKPPQPTAKTSTVPLKKETVRITLRAKPGAGITQPKEETTQAPTVAGSAPKPPVARAAAAPPPPAAGGAPAPPTNRPVTEPQPEMKKTQKVTVKAAPAAAPAPAKTVPLKSARPGVAPGGTAPQTKALPKATVKLQQPTQALGSPTGTLPPPNPTGTLSASDSVVLEDDDSESGMIVFSVIAAVLGLAALAIAMMTSDVVGLMVPEAKSVTWERFTGTSWTSSFDSTLPEVPKYE